MSYEGYETFLCEKGHVWYHSAGLDYGEHGNTCSVCLNAPKWECSTDQTNGYYEDEPGTHPPSMREIGFEDQWHVDHYGNRYALKVMKYEPVQDGRWRVLP